MEYNLVTVKSTPEEDDELRDKTFKELLKETEWIDRCKPGNKSTEEPSTNAYEGPGSSGQPQGNMVITQDKSPETATTRPTTPVPVKRKVSSSDVASDEPAPPKVPKMGGAVADGIDEGAPKRPVRGKGKGVGKKSPPATRRQPKP